MGVGCGVGDGVVGGVDAAGGSGNVAIGVGVHVSVVFEVSSLRLRMHASSCRTSCACNKPRWAVWHDSVF